MKHGFLLVALISAACGASPKAAPITSGGEGSGSGEAPGEKSWVEQCEACLADGKSWTADQCSDDCMMDTWCYGAGNPAAASCPAEAPPPDTAW
jgi:hypothetical protein